MAKPLSPKALTSVVLFLLKRSDEAHARLEAMRMLLENRGVFSADEFQNVFHQQEAAVKARSKQWLIRLLTDERSDAQRQFLEEYEGTVQ